MQQDFQNTNRKVKPLKKFGQNYLLDKNILRKIVDCVNIGEADTVLEIGPGTGALTEMLVETKANIVAVEIDTRVIEKLNLLFPRVRTINADILKINLNELFSDDKKPITVVGNIPYNITSPILFKLIEFRERISSAVLMMQLEVAQRIMSSVNTKEYGILSAYLTAYTEPDLCFKVSPNVFYPKPKVYSAVVRFDFKKNTQVVNDSIYLSLLKSAFSMRRKTLKNCLAGSIFETIDLRKFGIDPVQRAESVPVENFIAVANFAAHQLDKNIAS